MNAKRSVFQWNAGAWFGTLLGSTCWLLICSLLLVPENIRVAAIVGMCFLTAIVIGVGLWLARRRITPYPALQSLLAVVWLCSLAGVYAIELAGLWHVVSGVKIDGVGGTVSAGTMKLLIWLMFPIMMLWFHALNRQFKN
jgi:hypothetical protein